MNLLRMKKTSRSLFLAVVASTVLLPVCASSHQPIGEREAIQLRALLAPVTTTTANNPETSAPSTTTTTQTTSSTTSSSTSTTPSTSAAVATSHEQPSTSTPLVVTTTHANSVQPQTSSTPTTVATSVVPTTATNSAGQIVTSFVISTPTISSPTPSHTSSSDSTGSGGLSTGSIVGLSVSGGIAVLGVILFFVWKFTRKRFADFDDNEAIKWPELNAHNNDVHALPTNSTGRAGFGPEDDSDMNLPRAPSPGGAYANSIGTASVPETYGTGDPYAVPPLPHLNPNQPYRDDPGSHGQVAGYYDPYRGPVPGTFTDTAYDARGTESIPMTQMARMRSPVPQAPYDMQGRSSPAPQAAIGFTGMEERSRTPNPSALGIGSGRASPSPHPGYGYGLR